MILAQSPRLMAGSMVMGAEFLFIVGVSSLLLHEMDAIDKREWQLLFVLRRLPDDSALRWFTLLHLPLYVALLLLVSAAESGAVRGIEAGVDGFLIGHALLHERLGARGERAFANPFSRWLIWSAAAFGALHLAFLTLA